MERENPRKDFLKSLRARTIDLKKVPEQIVENLEGGEIREKGGP